MTEVICELVWQLGGSRVIRERFFTPRGALVIDAENLRCECIKIPFDFFLPPCIVEMHFSGISRIIIFALTHAMDGGTASPTF